MHRMKSHVTLYLFVGIFLYGSLAVAQQKGTYGPTNPADPALNQGPKQEAIGEKGMVSTQLAGSTLAALEVLESGGNAVDAAITAMFVQQVHDYHMSHRLDANRVAGCRDGQAPRCHRPPPPRPRGRTLIELLGSGVNPVPVGNGAKS